MARKLLAAFALSASLVLGGCVNPDGSLNPGATLMAGVGVAAATALIVGATRGPPPPRYYASGYGYRPGPGWVR
jgi:hypothetical protein